jgi:hypothetical protein
MMINVPSRIAPLIYLDTDSFYVPFKYSWISY